MGQIKIELTYPFRGNIIKNIGKGKYETEKHMLWQLLIVIFICLITTTMHIKAEEKPYQFDYTVLNGKAYIDGVYGGNAATLIVPETIQINGETCRVIGIGAKVFYNNKRLVSVVIPDTVTQIGNNAFAGCTKLKTVTIGKGIS